jgi:DNA modification methylase
MPLKARQTLSDGIGGQPNQQIENNRNNHPTVKPLALMKYLIQMITPEGGVVLDPFAGSGSTLVAAKELGYDFIGIEMTEEYIPIIEARLAGVVEEKQLSIL